MVDTDLVELTFLSGAKPLTKQISADDVIPYPNIRDLTSTVVPIKHIRDFALALQTHAGNGDALLVGKLTRQIKNASRAGLTDKTALARWVCLDFDKVPGFSPASALKELDTVCPGISTTSHVIQYSARSRLFKSTELSCHIFFMLDNPISPMELRNWIMHLNLSTRFENAITLNPSGIGFHYPIDPALAEQSRVIFISTPIFKPASLDPHPNDRLQYIEYETSELNTAVMVKTLPVYSDAQQKLVDKSKVLRKAMGLSPKKLLTAFKDDFCNNPDPCQVTGIRQDRGYIYLNLNGGDSWGYWYPENDPSVLYNFKGEPNYPLEKIAPDYWNMYVASSSTQQNPSGPGSLHFVFQDDHSGKTHSCIYNSHTAQLEISASLSDTAARRWLAAHKQNTKFFHVVKTFYDPRPAALLGVDLRLRTINTYEPTGLKPHEGEVNDVPPNIEILLRHVLNQPDPDPLISREYEHFLSWLSFIMQARERTGTAWLLHGTQGTGKGVLMHSVLRPLVGDRNFSVVNMQTMAERFTDRLDDKLLIGLDEIKREDFTKHPGLLNRLKNTITEETLTSRRFHNAPKETNNYGNFILTSNEQVPLEIPANDRRFNVAFGQPQPLRIRFNDSEEELSRAIKLLIPNELPKFYKFLLTRNVNRSLISVAINNKAKRNMVAAGRTSTQAFFDLIRHGQYLDFIDEYQRLKHGDSASATIMDNPTIIGSETIKKYREFVEKYLLVKNKTTIVITREQMSVLARIMLGKKIPMTPQRYDSWLAQFGIAETTVKCGIKKSKTKGVVMECQNQ